MGDLIDRATLIAELEKDIEFWGDTPYGYGIAHAWKMVKKQPPTDVVRCKDCKYGELDDPELPLQYFCRYDGGSWNNEKHFYSYGERRNDA